MRALQSDLATLCYDSTGWLPSRATSASLGRNGRTRQQLGVSSAHKCKNQRTSPSQNSFLVRTFCERGGGGDGGDGGGGSTPSTDFDDESGSPPGRRYSVLGITVTLVSPDSWTDWLASPCTACGRMHAVHAGLQQRPPPRRWRC